MALRIPKFRWKVVTVGGGTAVLVFAITKYRDMRASIDTHRLEKARLVAKIEEQNAKIENLRHMLASEMRSRGR